MKSEIREAAALSVETLIDSLSDKLTPVRVSKKDGWAFDTGVKDENGKPVYAVIEATVKNTEDTKTTTAFDFDAAVAARAEYDAQPKKEKSSKSKEADPEAEAKKAKREAQQAMLETWCMENLTAEGMTTTDIQSAVPDLSSVTITQVGTYLKNIAAANPAIKREVVKGKPYYSKVEAE